MRVLYWLADIIPQTILTRGLVIGTVLILLDLLTRGDSTPRACVAQHFLSAAGLASIVEEETQKALGAAHNCQYLRL